MMTPTAPETLPPAARRPVRRRLVCYLSGFDPNGAPHYHRLYTDEGALQAQASGYQLTVGPRRKAGPHVAWWDVGFASAPPTSSEPEPTGASPQVETRYEFLRWDDIVRQHWPRGVIGLLSRILWASAHLWQQGVMWRMLKTSWPRFLLIGLPGILLVLALLLGLGLGLAGASLAWQGHWSGLTLPLLGWPAIAWLARWADQHSYVSWLMRSIASMVHQGRGTLPDLDERLSRLAAHVAHQYRTAPVDELLIVGHSSGAMMATIVTARALALLKEADAAASTEAATAQTQATSERPVLSLLTLGHCFALISYQPVAQWFRDELASLTQAPALHWLDFGAPPDGCCLPMSDPTGPALPAGAPGRRPKLLNPRFAQMFSPARYKPVKRDKHRCHFQYLMASQHPVEYDYFAITAGPLTLPARFEQHPSNTNFRQFQLFGGPGW